tara:strand:+ start:38 stop:736 length:699 start_codon:yes stop_codon:yes gene_type:complete
MLGIGNSLLNKSYQWQPTFVGADLKLWLRNGVGVLEEQWLDSSGNEANAAQSSSGNQGSVFQGGIDFAGDEDNHYDLEKDIVCSSQEAFMIFMVCIFDSFDDQNSILGTGDNNVFLEFQTNRKIRMKAGGVVISAEYASGTFATGASAAVFGIQRESGSTGDIILFKNGSLVAPTNGQKSNTGSLTFNQVGARNSDRTFDGKILELLCYDTTDLTSSEISKINNYLKNKHGI